MSLRAGVDVGGTFTDLVLLDEETGVMSSAKAATDYGDPVNPIVDSLRLLVPSGQSVSALHHATTLSTNAIIEGRLPKGVLLTTQGFRDVLDIGRIQRPEAGIYDFNIDNPQPLISRARRIEVIERIDARGGVATPLDEADLRQKLRALKEEKIQSIAVCCLFSFRNAAHEERIAEIAREELPDAYVSISAIVSPEIREFERSSTVVLDSLLKPILAPYLQRLGQRLSDASVDRTRIVMASGGLTSPSLTASKPVTMINSGPAAGVLASANLGRQLNLFELVTIDMGGTSLDIGIVEAGRPVQKYQSEIAGYPIRMPLIDVAAVAAGGGSLAMIDGAGYLQVDRHSAGSNPGPACYGRGGERPTVTDADLALGRLGADLGGRGGFRLNLGLAQAAFEKTLCAELGVSLEVAATSMLDIIQARMVKAIASNTMEKGLDLRGLPLIVYGGAGPTHGVELADSLGMRRVIVPYLAGNFSAVGLLLCPLRCDESQMMLRAVSDLTDAGLADVIADLEALAREAMRGGGADDKIGTTSWLAHMRYAGQSYDLAIDLGESGVTEGTLERLRAAFHERHQRFYAYASAEEVVEIVQLRVSVIGPELDYPKPAAPAGPSIHKGSRPIYFTRDRKVTQAAIWDRASLPPGAVIAGPAVVEGDGSSTLLPSGWTATVDSWLNLDVAKS